MLTIPVWAAGLALLVWLDGDQPASSFASLGLGVMVLVLWLSLRRAPRHTRPYRQMAASFAVFAVLTMAALFFGPVTHGWLLAVLAAVAFAAFVLRGEAALRAPPSER